MINRRLATDRAVALLRPLDNRKPAYRAVADGLRTLIVDGRIPPDTRLPSERELTRALAVSRTTVSRSYALLKEQGYLTARQGSGSVTHLPRAHRAADSLLDPESSGAQVIDLSYAAPSAPPGLTAAYAAALEQLPGHLGGNGYYPSGLPALREAIADRYTARGLPTAADQVLVTSGGLSALAVAVRASVRAGDLVLAESPTYPNAIGAFRGAGARIAGADVSTAAEDAVDWATGSVVEAVRQLRPAVAYLMPDFHNPTGHHHDDEQRSRLATALRAARVLPVVDETLAELVVDDPPPALPFAAHAAQTLTIGSASKVFWGGLRIGWLRVPSARMAPLVTARLSVDLGAPLLEQLTLLHLLGQQEELLALRRSQLRASRSALVSALTDELPSWRFREPAGGLSLWCELPRPASTALAAAAQPHGVRLAPGPLFAPEGGLERFLRIPFVAPPETLTDAVPRIARAWGDVRPGRPTRRPTPTLVG